ncbi:MAG: tetratricopeptide repeat protein, partial [bacterium]|nr:tetratricopeptide repeat protein [bacterium]
KKMDFKTSETIYRKILEKNPESIHALHGMAKIFHYLNRFDESETYIKKCYQTDPQFGSAYLLHSKIHRMRQDNDAWKKTARKAMELSPLDADARITYARTLMRGEGKLKEGAEQAKIALKTDPYSLSAHHYFGRGYTAMPYKEYKPEGDEKTIQEITRLYQQGDRHLVNGEYAKADQAFTALLKLDPQHIRAIIGKGAAHFHQKQYDTALDLFFRALKINPDYGLAHYSVTLVLQKRLDRVNVRFPGLEKRFAETNAPTLPYLEDVFINYHQCSTGLQKIIRLTAAPLGNYMKALKIAGATVHFMDIHQFLWESPGMKGIKGRRTFDLRLWDDVKGSGGYNCISNKSQQADVKYLRFNIAGHEFAHLVQQVLTPAQRKELRRLYLKAKKERITLDWYADMNDWEYFAVGYEAYISEEKLPGQSDVYAHTRKELLEKDPDLYRFIDGLNKTADYRENEIMGFIMKAGYSSRDPEKRIKIFKEGLATYGNHPVLLNALAEDYSRRKNHDAALETYQKAIEIFPGDTEAYLEIATDIFDREKDTAKAIAFLKKHEARLSNDAGYFFHLGTMYYYAGEIDKMETAMRAGLKLDPWP